MPNSILCLRLHRKLYTRESINAASEAYQEVCTAQVRPDVTHYVIEFDNVDPEVRQVLTQEFANYALAETIEGRRAT